VSAEPGQLEVARISARLSDEARALLAARLQALMNERGLSARRLAANARVHYSQVADVLARRGDPKLSVMLALVKELNLRSIEELVSPLGTGLLLAGPVEFGTAPTVA
jgi:DNA-binding phage protein